MQPSFIVRSSALAVAISAAACASLRGAPVPAETVAAEGAAYSCVLSALRASDLPVVQADSQRLVVTARQRDELTPGGAAASGGATGGTESRLNPAAPYLIDIVTASVALDHATGRPVVNVSASSGAGATSGGGYAQRPASDRAQKAARAAQACVPAA